jgi:hypothetical protein
LKFVDSERFEGKVTVTAPAPIPRPVAGTQCGVWRWNTKVLADPAAARIEQEPLIKTVRELVGLRPPRTLQRERIAPVEFSTYTIEARLIEYKLEEDSDLHLVVGDPKTGATMIVEFPADGCTQGAAPADQEKMSRARTAFLRACGLPKTSDPRSHVFTKLAGTATITGVGFFDFVHGQTGVAPNGIELHPALEFHSTHCRST